MTRKLLPLLALSVLTSASGLTVKHERGTLELKAPAQRIVALDFAFQDALVALGTPPVGYADYGIGPQPYLRDGLKNSVIVGKMFEPSLEKIASLKPDLIIADTSRQGQLYDQLSKIAPTIMFNSYNGDDNEQIRELGIISEIVGKKSLGQQLIAGHQARVNVLKKSVRANGTTALGVVTPKEFWVYDNESFLGSLLERVGKPNAVHGKDGQGHIFVYSLDSLAATNPDNLLFFVNPGEEQILLDWEKQPVFQQLKAVRAGRVYVFSRELWAKGRGVLAFRHVLDEATRSGYLLGKPATPGFSLSTVK